MTDKPHALDLVRTPKLDPSAKPWYRYYAGFSPNFVDDMCNTLGVEAGVPTLDPWMGSGTTLSVAAGRGAAVAGLDLNPVMIAVARGRLLARDTITSLNPLGLEVVASWKARSLVHDPLRAWFDEPTAAQIRGLSRRIQRMFIGKQSTSYIDIRHASSLACFFLIGLFDVVSAAVRAYGSRNPTWIKGTGGADGVVRMSKADIVSAYLAAIRRLSSHLQFTRAIETDVHDLAQLRLGDSRSLPFKDSSFDVVLSSPPYLTRLDYAMGHAPELAVLGYGASELRSLRSAMIGTPTRSDEKTEEPLGEVAVNLLDQVAEHGSYAASTYYEPNFRQYFVGMASSFRELERVTSPGGQIALVVQDSRFKEIHLDLAGALTGMAETRGWATRGRKDFVNVRSMAQLNKRAHPVAQKTKPTESVICFELPKG